MVTKGDKNSDQQNAQFNHTRVFVKCQTIIEIRKEL